MRVPPTEIRPWFTFEMSAFAIAALLLIGGLLLLRLPYSSASVRDATRLLRKLDSNFDPAKFRVVEAAKSADGLYAHVRFVRTEGDGQKHYDVNVPERQSWISRVRGILGGD